MKGNNFSYEGNNIEYHRFNQSTRHEHRISYFDKDFIEPTRHYQHLHSCPCNDYPRNRNTDMDNFIK